MEYSEIQKLKNELRQFEMFKFWIDRQSVDSFILTNSYFVEIIDLAKRKDFNHKQFTHNLLHVIDRRILEIKEIFKNEKIEIERTVVV